MEGGSSTVENRVWSRGRAQEVTAEEGSKQTEEGKISRRKKQEGAASVQGEGEGEKKRRWSQEKRGKKDKWR